MAASSRKDSRHGARKLPTLRLVSAPSAEAAATDEQLFREVRTHDDRTAFDAIVHRYETELCGFLRRYLGSAESAEDVFQATFLKVYLNRLRFVEGCKFRPWLYTVAKNQAIDSQRRVQARRMVSLDQSIDRDCGSDTMAGLLPAGEETADEQLEEQESTDQVRAAVAGLPATLQESLVLVYYRGMKYEEAARRIGVPVGTVKSRVHTAIVKLGGTLRA